MCVCHDVRAPTNIDVFIIVMLMLMPIPMLGRSIVSGGGAAAVVVVAVGRYHFCS